MLQELESLETRTNSEGESNRRLYAAFLLTFLRDLIPRLRSRYIKDQIHVEYLRYPQNLLEVEMQTAIFELACDACELHVDLVRSTFREIQRMNATKEESEWHFRAFPNGGISAVFIIGSTGGNQA